MRGATALAEVGGHGMTCDAYHITRPHPEAAGSIGAMEQAIERSGLATSAIDFVNAHGTGTKHNDSAESKVMKDVFGDHHIPHLEHEEHARTLHGRRERARGDRVPPHAQQGVYPPTIGYETPDPECDVDVVANVARTGKSGHRARRRPAFTSSYDSVTYLSRQARRAPGAIMKRARSPPPASPTPSARAQRNLTTFQEAVEPGGGAHQDRPPPLTTERVPGARSRRWSEVRRWNPTKCLGDKGLRTLNRLTKLLIM